MAKLAWMIFLYVILFALPSTPVLAADPLRDPFYTEGESIAPPSINTVSESVDPFSGILTLTHTDIHLPGNGGLDVNLIRTYNSMIWGRRDTDFPGLVAKNERSPIGIGWTMHMGIVHNPLGKGSRDVMFPDNPVVEMPDGSKHVLYKDKNDTTRFITRDFWIYKLISGGSGSGTWELTLTDGTVYTFEYSTGNAGYDVSSDTGDPIDKIAQVTKIRNAANTATISIGYYKDNNGYHYLKTITDSCGRIITLNYDYTAHKLTNIKVDDRTFEYGFTKIDAKNNYLTSFTPPVGSAWSYDYENSSNTYELNSITYPTGGKISYTYEDTIFATATDFTPEVEFRVVKSRKTSGRGITDNTWNYVYNSSDTAPDKTFTTITTTALPVMSETHLFYGWGDVGNESVWKVGLPRSITFSGAFSLKEEYQWDQSPSISSDKISNAGWSGTIGRTSDSNIYVPLRSVKKIIRDAQTYTTTYSDFDSYGNPKLIAETGDVSRTRTLVYSPYPSVTKNIVKGKPYSESLSGAFTGTASKYQAGSKSWDYYTDSGNVKVFTDEGVTTSYEYNDKGNLKSKTDANLHTATYEWQNGVLNKETYTYDPGKTYTVSRVINADSTIESETNGREYKTSFTYDDNLRPTGKTPPIGYGNFTTIIYNPDNQPDGYFRRDKRENYYITYSFDGFGRPTGSSDTRGVTTTIAYTPYGSKDFEDSNTGDRIFYDYFGRVTKILHKDGESVTYLYDKSNVTITDEKSNTVTLTYEAFGNPDERYLMGVKDQALNTTTYTRNIQGNITSIKQGTLTRSYDYETTQKNFLQYETNPETGTISYEHYNVGTLKKRTDAFGSTTYLYDDIDRLKSIDAVNVHITFGYDKANNRETMTYPGGSVTYTNDPANRLTKKEETVLPQSEMDSQAA